MWVCIYFNELICNHLLTIYKGDWSIRKLLPIILELLVWTYILLSGMLKQMESKRDAEKTESQLLKTFDYAWNKGSNGSRRLNDVIKKLESLSSKTSPFPSITRKLRMLGQKQVGIRIKARKQILKENALSTDQDINSLLARVFKFGRSRPRLVSDRVGTTGEHGNVCGVALGDGIICERPPVEGRKRCSGHKGMKTKSSFSKPIVERKPQISEVNHNGMNFHLVRGKCSDNEEFTIICGVILNDGLPCKRLPVQGRKRCEEHKGMRIRALISNSMIGKPHHTDDLIMKSSDKFQPQVLPECSISCGVELGHGKSCEKLPVVGRKRCEEHKGMRIHSLISKLAAIDGSK